ncbi:MAG: helix-turn-helix domain-containing protein [Solirubrobacteraceae bacterium]
MAADQDEFLTVAEIAAQFKVNQQTVRNWIDRGELGAVRLGSRRVRVPASELARFIAASASTAMPKESQVVEELHAAWEAYLVADSEADQAAALRTVAKAATTLARALSR